MTTAKHVADLGFDPDALRERYRTEREKRLRPDGNDQYLEVEGERSHFAGDPYVEPGYTREPLADDVDVVLIGGGFGGLLAGARLRQLGVESIRVIEHGARATEFGEHCTPGYYNNEGQPTDMGRQGGFYFGGPTEFVETLEAWRADGSMKGLQASPSPSDAT